MKRGCKLRPRSSQVRPADTALLCSRKHISGQMSRAFDPSAGFTKRHISQDDSQVFVHLRAQSRSWSRLLIMHVAVQYLPCLWLLL